MGLLDAFSTPDAQLGFGLLGAAAPSMVPMNLAGRLAQGNQNFKNLTTADLANQTAAQNLMMNNIGLQRAQQQWALQLPIMQYVASHFNGGAQGMPDAATQQPQAPAVPSQIGTAQTIGGQPMFSGQLTSTPQPQTAPQPVGAPRQSRGMFPGVPDDVAATNIAFGGFPALLPILNQYNAPTDATKMANQAGLDPRLANAEALRKTTYIAPTRLGEGAYNDPVLGVQGLPTAAPPGFINVKDANGQWSTQRVSGGPEAVSAAQTAKTMGTANATPSVAYDANRNPIYSTQGNDVRRAMGGTSNGRYPGEQGGPLAPALAPGAQAAGTEAGKGSGQLYNADNAAANGYATRMFALNKALTGLQGADTGPGSEAVNGVKSLLMAQSPAWLAQHLPGVDPNKIASYDEANKYLIQYAMGQVGSMGEGTDAKLATTLSGNANTHISNLAAQDVVKASAGLERMRNAQINQFNQTGLPPDQYQKWASQWNRTINPQVFVWDSLDPAKKAAAAKDMSPTQRQAFTTQYNWALQNKFIDGSQ